MPSQDTTLLLYHVISSCVDLLSASFKHVYNVLVKVHNVTI